MKITEAVKKAFDKLTAGQDARSRVEKAREEKRLDQFVPDETRVRARANQRHFAAAQRRAQRAHGRRQSSQQQAQVIADAQSRALTDESFGTAALRANVRTSIENTIRADLIERFPRSDYPDIPSWRRAVDAAVEKQLAELAAR